MSLLSGQLQHASLRVDDGDPLTRELKFMYNPAELSTSKSSTWSRPQSRAASSATQPAFAGSNPQSVTMEIWFDSWDDPFADVTGKVKTLFEWTRPTRPSVDRGTPRPPVLRFEWGTSTVLADFRGFLKSVNAKFVLFKPDGTPIRASCNLSLEEVPEEPARQNPTSGSLESRRTWLMNEGDSLASVAWREYRDANLWRGIAAFNAIDDPMRVQPGTRVLIPTADEARRLTAIEP
jgi:nucleoid-associated protein YgaU